MHCAVQSSGQREPWPQFFKVPQSSPHPTTSTVCLCCPSCRPTAIGSALDRHTIQHNQHRTGNHVMHLPWCLTPRHLPSAALWLPSVPSVPVSRMYESGLWPVVTHGAVPKPLPITPSSGTEVHGPTPSHDAGAGTPVGVTGANCGTAVWPARRTL